MSYRARPGKKEHPMKVKVWHVFVLNLLIVFALVWLMSR